jgi:hypothetical protein
VRGDLFFSPRCFFIWGGVRGVFFVRILGIANRGRKGEDIAVGGFNGAGNLGFQMKGQRNET